MSETSITSSEMGPMQNPLRRLFKNSRFTFILGWALPILIVLAGLLYWVIPQLAHPSAPKNAPMPVSATIEEKYGIRITQVAVTADGGLIDLRYVVIDPDKARSFAADADTTPQILPQSGSVALTDTAPMSHKELLHAGTTYFLLYHDNAGTVKPGNYITVVLGSIKLEHVPVR